MTALWGRRFWPVTRRVALSALVMMAIFTLMGLFASDLSLFRLLWMAAANVVSACLMGALMSRCLGANGGAPRVASDTTWVALAGLFPSMVGVAFGAVPGVYEHPDHWRLALWWTIRMTTYASIGLLTFSILAYWRGSSRFRIRKLAHVPILVTASLFVIYLTFRFPDAPVSWVLPIPALYAGVVLTPRGVSIFALTFSLLTAFPNPAYNYVGLLPPSLLIDLEIVYAAFMGVYLALGRDQLIGLIRMVKRQRREAQAQTKLLHTVFDAMSDGLVLGDEDHVDLHNRASDRLLGSSLPQDLLTSPGSAAAHGLRTVDGDRVLTEADLKALVHPTDEAPELIMLPASGAQPAKVIALTTRSVQTRDQAGRMLLLLHDATAEYDRFRQLSRFAGTVAHDLKSPLTSVLGWVDETVEALEDDDYATAQFAATKARQSGLKMRQIIDDWLAYVVAKEGVLRLTRLPLAPLVDEVTELNISHRREGGPVVVNKVTHIVHADRSLVRQVLSNVLGNAIKYARPGEDAHVEISSAQQGRWIQVEVADHGVGIQPGDEERIFGAFARSARDAENYQGTGLGLALCRSIITRHGGTISATGNEHGGATIRFTLPGAA